MTKQVRVASKAAFFAVEGKTEEAFLNHLKSIYARNNGYKITVKSVDGGSSLTALAHARRSKADFSFVIFDSDRFSNHPGELEEFNKTDKGTAKIFISKPQFEFVLLRALGITIGKANNAKKTLSHEIGGEITLKYSYARRFSSSDLERIRKSSVELDALICLIEDPAFEIPRTFSQYP